MQSVPSALPRRPKAHALLKKALVDSQRNGRCSPSLISAGEIFSFIPSTSTPPAAFLFAFEDDTGYLFLDTTKYFRPCKSRRTLLT